MRTLLALALVLAGPAAADPLRPADLARVRHAHQLAWSADGQTLAFTVTPAESLTTRDGSRLWLSQPGRPARALPARSPADQAASFAPDGRRLVFLARDDAGHDQPWILDLDAGATRPLTVFPGGVVAGPWWSPRGDRIAVVAAFPGAARHLVLLTPDRPGQRRLRFSAGVHAAAWSPDGSSLAAVATNPGGTRALALVDPAEADVRWLPLETPRPEPPGWSPAGTELTVRRDIGERTELVAWELSTGAARVLSLGLEDRTGGPAVWVDATTLALPVVREGRRNLAALDQTPEGLRLRWLTGQLESAGALDRPGRVAARPGPQGGIAYVRSTPRTPDEVMLWDPALTRPRRLTLLHRDLLERGLSSVEAARVPTTAGEIPVLFTHPSDPARTPPYPALWLPEPPGREPGAGFDPLAQVAAGNYVLAVRTPTLPDPVAQWRRMDALLTVLRANNLVDASPMRVVGPTATLEALWAARNRNSQSTDQNRYNGRMPDHWLRLDGTTSPGFPDRSSLGKLDSWLQKP